MDAPCQDMDVVPRVFPTTCPDEVTHKVTQTREVKAVLQHRGARCPGSYRLAEAGAKAGGGNMCRKKGK
ncbi:hypothetical protein E2C01_020811 [Portunus trituberculatus]|uniref:Uncharacterized protein n=1 Tax=Portunus trituberculatus TaxID=210409 RepID=A0A5B7E3B8_PORTR|nr:hypothetical protein [Portunus trituberculatus]